MFKIKCRTAEIKVAIEYIDVNGILYDALAYVVVNSSYEIEGVRFSLVEAFDKYGEPCEPELIPIIREQLEALAGARALEKIHSEDFCKEGDAE